MIFKTLIEANDYVKEANERIEKLEAEVRAAHERGDMWRNAFNIRCWEADGGFEMDRKIAEKYGDS